jgi:NAD-dependent dihydropyrimidine dehydrogenase PreA subunit
MDAPAVETSYRVIVHLDNCKACYYCNEICPQDVFEISAEINRGGYFPVRVVREDQCTGCLLCYFICPDFAISVESDYELS